MSKKQVGWAKWAILSALVVGLTGCNRPEVRMSRCDPALDGNGTAQAPAEEFSKPETYDEWEDQRDGLGRGGIETGGEMEEQFGRQQFVAPRDHMRPQFDVRTETWLNGGESAVIDLGVHWHASDEYPTETIESELMVFVDFRPVNFDLIRVDGDPAAESFPRVEEATDVDEWHRSQKLTLPEETRKAYTLVVPPEAFGERGAHDVRIVSFEKSHAHRGIEEDADVTNTWEAMTVNYGGTQFAAGPKLERMGAEMKLPSDHVRRSLSEVHTLLVPPGKSTEGFLESHTGKTFVVGDERARMNGWMEGVSRVDQVSFAWVVLKGDRMVDGSRSVVTLPDRPTSYRISGRGKTPNEPYAAKFDLEVPLESYQPREVRMVSFRDPLCEEGFGEVRVSNSVNLERDSLE